jgi:hypothetical protein
MVAYFLLLNSALVCCCVSCWLSVCLRHLFSRCAHTLMLTLLLLLPCRHLRNAWQQWRLVSKSWTSIAAVAATLGQEQVGPAACCPACAAAPLEPGEQETGKACLTSHCFGSCLGCALVVIGTFSGSQQPFPTGRHVAIIAMPGTSSVCGKHQLNSKGEGLYVVVVAMSPPLTTWWGQAQQMTRAVCFPVCSAAQCTA